MHTEKVESFFVTSTEPERDRFGWTICSALVRKQVLACVNIADGAYTTVDIVKTYLSFATRLLLLLMVIAFYNII